MVNTGEIESYLNNKSAKRDEIVEIIGEGNISDIPQKDGTKRRGLNIPIKLNGTRELIYSPGKTALKELQKAWGIDTKDWVGKKAVVDFIKMTSFGEIKDVLIIKPIKAEKA